MNIPVLLKGIPQAVIEVEVNYTPSNQSLCILDLWQEFAESAKHWILKLKVWIHLHSLLDFLEDSSPQVDQTIKYKSTTAVSSSDGSCQSDKELTR